MSSLATSPGSRAGRLDLVGGRLALDYANTSSGRESREHLEHLQTPGDLLAWARHARLWPSERSPPDEGEVEQLFVSALALREAIHAIGLACATGRQPDPRALAELTALHGATLLAAELAPRQGAYAWHWPRAATAFAALLGPIALSAVTLLQADELNRVKQCGGRHCGWLFYDATKNRRRRWCEMSVCGNRAKQHRLRQRRSTPPP